MGFDKAKAMRNAERYVAQGKIRSAIAEYRTVVENDPRDIATLNMLGDLYAKNAENNQAVNCYLQVADHYNTQGFAQKAIAIYNKVSRIQPESIEVSAKLAELHKVKGSLAEAREHYTTLAEHYQKKGRRLEALAMWKQIAMLDPNNTEVCLSLADSFFKEGQKEEAVEAYADAGGRFSRKNQHEDAIKALMKGFDIKSTDMRILEGLVTAHTALGRAGKAVSLLEEILENEPYNRDVLYLLIDCCIDSQNAAGAEKAVTRLVEIEPANYPRYLDLIRIYLNAGDPASASRILTMSSEYLLAAGQADECSKWIIEILERDPNLLAGLWLLVRYHSFLNDENGFMLALERVCEAAAAQESIDDERHALAQLVVIRPHETEYRERLDEINEKYGFEDSQIDEELLRAQFAKTPEPAEGSSKEAAVVNPSTNGHAPHGEPEIDPEKKDDVIDAEIIQQASDDSNAPARDTAPELSASDEQNIQKELDSITFYIENDYNELAEKAIGELVSQYGDRPEFAALRNRIGAEVEEKPQPVEVEYVANTLGIDEIRSEFGIETADESVDDDYDTHYHTAVAYQEMGLLEEAIREFQDAIALAQPTDGTRRFFQCANLLGHCFLQKGRSNHAITWFGRALEAGNVSDEEQHGLWYEIASAYENSGDAEKAAMFFDKIYAENVDFRDVSERMGNLTVNS